MFVGWIITENPPLPQIAVVLQRPSQPLDASWPPFLEADPEQFRCSKPEPFEIWCGQPRNEPWAKFLLGLKPSNSGILMNSVVYHTCFLIDPHWFWWISCLRVPLRGLQATLQAFNFLLQHPPDCRNQPWLLGKSPINAGLIEKFIHLWMINPG